VEGWGVNRADGYGRPPVRRIGGRGAHLALVGWLLAGTCCAGIWLYAWTDPLGLRDAERWLAARLGGALRGDLILHALAGFLLGAWLAVGCRLFAPRWTLWLPFAITTAVAVADEALQALEPGRTVEFADLAASLAGLALTVPLVWWLARRQRRERE